MRPCARTAERRRNERHSGGRSRSQPRAGSGRSRWSAGGVSHPGPPWHRQDVHGHGAVLLARRAGGGAGTNSPRPVPRPRGRGAWAAHTRRWSGRPAPNGSGGPGPARAEVEAIEVLFTIYRAYEEALRAQSLRDFDDLLLGAIDALERVPEFRRRCRERFRYLIVDEFQDTNRIQLDFIRLPPAERFGNVTPRRDAN